MSRQEEQEHQVTYLQFMYNMQWMFFQDVKDDYLSITDKEQWLALLPQVWQGFKDEETMAYSDILIRLCQIFGQDQLTKFMELVARSVIVEKPLAVSSLSELVKPRNTKLKEKKE